MDGAGLDGETLVGEDLGLGEVHDGNVVLAINVELFDEATSVIGVGTDDDQGTTQIAPETGDYEGFGRFRGGGGGGRVRRRRGPRRACTRARQRVGPSVRKGPMLLHSHATHAKMRPSAERGTLRASHFLGWRLSLSAAGRQRSPGAERLRED